MGVVYAKTDCVVAWSGGMSPLSKGDVWDDSADLVKDRPDLFSKEPTRVRGLKAAPEKPAPAETATAAPGEQRAAVRKTR